MTAEAQIFLSDVTVKRTMFGLRSETSIVSLLVLGTFLSLPLSLSCAPPPRKRGGVLIGFIDYGYLTCSCVHTAIDRRTEREHLQATRVTVLCTCRLVRSYMFLV